jgi:hypothetical protein
MARKRLSTKEICDLALRARHGAEGERVEATIALVTEYRSQSDTYRKQDRARRNAIIDGRRDNPPVEIDPLLLQAINECSRKIFADDDPVRALKKLLGKKPGRSGDVAAPSAVERKLKGVPI